MLRRPLPSDLRRTTIAAAVSSSYELLPSSAPVATLQKLTNQPTSPLSDSDKHLAGTIAAAAAVSSAALSPLSSHLTEPILLRALDLVRPPAAALRLYRWAHPLLSSHSADRVSHKTLKTLCRSRDLTAAADFLCSLAAGDSTSPLHDRFFNTLLRAYSAAGRLREAIDVFKSIPSATVYSYNSLLSALLRRGRTRAAARLYLHMRDKDGVLPDVCTFNTLIRGFCLNSMVDEGFLIFNELKRRNCLPDILTYNILLDGLCRIGKVDTARHLFDGMCKEERTVSPNVVSYTTLIRGYCSKLQAAEAMQVFDDMVEIGVKPNKITFNTLIQGLCEAKRMDFVKSVMQRFQFKPDTCTFNILIAAHCSSGNVVDAKMMFDKMVELRVKPDSASYSTLVRGLCNIEEFKRAEELVDELLDKDILGKRGGCVPLMAAYNPVFDHLCHSGKTEKAGRLFRKLLDNRAKVDIVAFKILIMGHCRDGQPRRGYELLITMVRRDLKPDLETCETLIKMFLQKNSMHFAWKSMQIMLGSGYLPKTSTFHLLLSGLLTKDDCVEDASDLVQVMLERKVRQNIDLSTNLISSLFRIALSDRAFKILQLLYENGYSVKMEKLVTLLCQIPKFVEARELLLFCLEKNHDLDSELYDIVVSKLCSAGRVVEAFSLFHEITDKQIAPVTFTCLKDLMHALQMMGKRMEAEFVAKRISCARADAI